MADAEKDLWRITYDDKKYVLSRTDITVGILRQMRQWYGAPYGKYLSFVQLLLEGDGDAWACAIWIVQRAAGENGKKPQNLDFAVSDVMQGFDEDEDEDVDVGPTPLAQAAVTGEISDE